MPQSAAQLHSAMWNNTGKNKTLEPLTGSSVLLLAVKLSAKYFSFWRCKAFPKRQILCYTFTNIKGEGEPQIKTENS